MENITLNGYAVDAIQATAGAECGIAHFPSGLDTTNRLDPSRRAETSVVTIDSIIGSRTAAGIKVDVEGFGMDVLRGCSRTLSEHRLKLIQLEWNATSRNAVGTDRGPIVDLLTRHGYQLYRPDRSGVLRPVTDTGFGPDVFAGLVPHP